MIPRRTYHDFFDSSEKIETMVEGFPFGSYLN